MKPGPDHREASALTTSPFLTRVVQKVSNAIHRINRYAVDSVVCFVSTCPHDSDLSADSVIQPLKNWEQVPLVEVLPFFFN